MPEERIIKPAEPINIRARQPSELRKGAINIEIGLDISKKYVQCLFPGRLKPMEGLLLSPDEAIALGNLFIEKARLIKN